LSKDRLIYSVEPGALNPLMSERSSAPSALKRNLAGQIAGNKKAASFR
jgi:hypothetical protein